MKEEFVTYDQAVALKELGFDEDCLGRWLAITEWEEPTGEIKLQLGVKVEDYDKNQCLAPLKQQVFRWFREKCNIQGYMYPLTIEGYKNGRIFTNYVYTIKPLYGDIIESEVFETYEEAESACIDKLIEIVKKK